MAEDQDNGVLRLLREIRGQQVDDGRNLACVERHIQEKKEQIALAMGMSGIAAATAEAHGEGMDEIRDEIAALQRGVQDLECRK